MAFEIASLIAALVICLVLVFASVFHIIVFDELKNDFKNPIEQCRSLNPLVLPEYLVHLAMTIFLLIGTHWILFILNIPLVAYNIYRYKTRPKMSSPGIHDPTMVLSVRYLRKAQYEGWTKLAFNAAMFFIYLYNIIYILVSD